MLIKDARLLQQQIKRYQYKGNVFLMLQMVVVILLIVLITWMFLIGYWNISQTPKALMFYLFPVGIGAHVIRLWARRRKNLATMLTHEASRLSANPYSYAISDEQMKKQMALQSSHAVATVADHALLGRFVGDIKYPALAHGVVWMRLLYAGIAILVSCAFIRHFVTVEIAGFTVSAVGCIFVLFCALLLGVANGVRRIRIYQFGIENRSVTGKDLIFFKDIFDVCFNETKNAGAQKIESAQLDLQCIGMNVCFYISDARQAYYEQLRSLAQVILQASLHPVHSLHKEMEATTMCSGPSGV